MSYLSEHGFVCKSKYNASVMTIKYFQEPKRIVYANADVNFKIEAEAAKLAVSDISKNDPNYMELSHHDQQAL